jgi:hypothetical protein
VELVDLSRVEVPTEWRLRFGDDTTGNLGAYLREFRTRRRITLESVASRTKIKLEFFEELERNNLSKWPASPFYRESYLRAYASAIGLEPQEVVDRYRVEFEHIEPQEAPPPQAAKTTGIVPPSVIPVIVVVTFAIAYSLGRWYAPVPIETGHPVSITSMPMEQQPVAPQPDAPVASAATPAAVPEVPTATIEGELVVTSMPSGAQVTVNGIGRGPTPVQVRYLPLGTHTVRVVHDGHPAVTRQVTISPERFRARITVTFDAPRTTN